MWISGSRDDTRFWQPTVDKAGNGMAVVRFLPAPSVDGEDAIPWVRVFSHGFQGPGGWYIENSLTTLNQKDPVSEYNTTLWNSGIEANKEIARKQKRRLNYIANVYVISDPSNPENEGQIKLFKFGKKIFDKITEAMNPEFADETPVNPFDMWEGANFKLKIRNVVKLETLWKQEHSLKEFLDPKHFKPYDVLKARLDKVLGFEGEAAPRTKAEDVVINKFKDDDSALEDIDLKISTSGGDDDLDFFKSLADQE